MNILQQGDGDLVAVNYSDLLEKILRALRSQNPFKISGDRRRLLIDIDDLAASLATSAQVQNPLESSQGVRSASVNFSRGFREVFPGKVREIRECLRQLLESKLRETGAIGSIQELVAGLITGDLQSFPGNRGQLGFAYDFGKRYDNLVKQKLSLEFDRPGSESLLKFHKLTIAVRKIDEFHKSLMRGLENYIEREVPWESEEDKSDLYSALDRLENAEFSDFYQLKEIVDTETLGKLKKEAKITYLEHLRDSIETQDTAGLIYLRDLIRRLRLIEDYISADRPDGDYEVSYAGVTLNYKDAFSRAEALDALPIIPIVGGYLGENTDRSGGEIQFIFGLKLKLAGRVQALGGDEVFDYNLDIINPDSKKHQEEIGDSAKQESFARRVLRRVFLYFFVFACDNPSAAGYTPDDDLNYDPVVVFDTEILPVLQGNDEEAKKRLFRDIVSDFNECNVRHKISRLKELLKNFLERQAILPTRTYPIHIAVRKGILNRDIDSMINGAFFGEVLGRNPKECLRYISIGGAHVDEDALCQMPASITIEDIRYFPGEEREKFSWEYDIKGISALPVAWVPKQEPCWNVYTRTLQQNKLVLFPYDNTRLNDKNLNRLDTTQAFVYQFTWVVLALICLNLLLENAPKNLFVPMVRLHEGDHDNPFPVEKFLANLSKGLSHLLNEKCRSSSQGFREKKLSSFTLGNGLSSLYSVLPKKFRFVEEFPTLEKLAIIIVSSVESDARTGSKNRNRRISNLLGEVVSVTRQADGTVRLEVLKTFSDNYPNWRIYRDAPVLINTLDNLYREGYRHFLYIAQAPYSSTLHITRSQGEEELYFMSPRLIKELKGERQDIKIYPVFFDKYYVRKLKDPGVRSLYVSNTEQLTSLSSDPQQQAVVFFNLFNGITVGGKKELEERFYNGVVSYATLVNIYEGILDDMDIRRGLLEDTPLKADLLQYLTLFHFSRFEKNSNISLKLDPYENIIGEDSFGKLSIFPHSKKEIEFNALAFMTEIKKALIEEGAR